MSTLLEQASLVMIPSGYKEDVVYSQIPTDGSGDLSFTRASNGTRVNSAGLVEVCPWNLLEQSETFDNATWIKSNATITANNTTAPNGTTTADKIAANGTLTSSYFAVGQSIANNIIGQPYTATLYAKAGTIPQMLIYLGASNGIYWNLSNGQFISYYSGVQNIIAYNSEAVGDGWYKYTISLNASSTTISFESYAAKSGDIFANYTTADNYFIWGAQLNIGATAKPYFPTTDRLNVPRLTYQNGGGGCPSLLLEKQSTNLAIESEQLNLWNGANASVTANTSVSPDGTQNADNVNITATNGYWRRNPLTFANSTSYTASIFVKKSATTGTKTFGFYYNNNVGSPNNGMWNCVINLTNITATTTAGGTAGTGIPTILSTNIVDYGSGWYRVEVAFTTGSAAGNSGSEIGFESNGVVVDFLAWGAQVEQSSYATSYIPTTSASATRVADACSKTGISSLIGQSEGFIAGEVEGLTNSYGAQSTIMSVSDGTTQNRVMFSFNATTGYVTPRIFKAGSTIFVTDYGITLTQKIKFAIGWGGGRAVCYVNGTQVQETTGLTFFSSGTLTRFGADDGAGSNIGIGKVSEYILGTSNLTNAELQSLTI